MSHPPQTPRDVPAGFMPLDLGTGYGALFGSMYRRAGESEFILGFYAERHHMNNFESCHGGAIAFVADMQLAAVKSLTGNGEGHYPTKQLTVDYIAPIKLGDWTEMKVELVRMTRKSIYTHGVISVDDKSVVRTTAIYHVPHNQ